jgi:glycosyltransferase involved in cell wall biosynthesis
VGIATLRSVLLVGNFLSATVGTRGVCEDLSNQLHLSGWNVVTTSNRKQRLPRLSDMLATCWRQRRHYDVAQVDVYSGPAFLWAEAVCWLLQHIGKPYVLTLHGGNLPSFARRWPRRVRRLLHSAGAVTTPSNYLLKQLRMYRADLLLLPNPVDLAAYDFKLRQQPRPHLVWLRAFHQIYNPSLAPQVLSRLVADIPDVQLTMVGPDKGDGSLQRTLEEAARLNVTNRMNLPGGVTKPEVPRVLNTGDIFLNTTNFDNTPVSVLEAMACGLCVVSTNVGGIPYLLEDGFDALLVPPDDPQAMADAVCRILTEPGIGGQLSLNAHTKAEQFDWAIVLPQWEDLLVGVIKA